MPLDALPSEKEVDAIVATLERIGDDPVACTSGIIATKMLKRALTEAQGDMIRDGEDGLFALISSTMVDTIARQGGGERLSPEVLAMVARSLVAALRPHFAAARGEPLQSDASRFGRLSSKPSATVGKGPAPSLSATDELAQIQDSGDTARLSDAPDDRSKSWPSVEATNPVLKGG